MLFPSDSEYPKAFCKNLATIETNSSTFSSWGMWPQFLITSKVDPGMALESLSAFQEGTIRSVSPVTIRTGFRHENNKYYQEFILIRLNDRIKKSKF